MTAEQDSPTAPAERVRILKAAGALGGSRPGSDRARRLLMRVCDPHVDLAELEIEVAREPALYARVLRVANSSYYRNAKSVTTISRAIVVLGLDAVRGIVAAGCLDPLVGRHAHGTPLDVDAIVGHSLATAVAADHLATRYAPAVKSDAFVAGLLHNLGIFVQLKLDVAAIARLVAGCATQPFQPIRELEATAGVPGHEACLALAFEDWAMAAPFTAVARHHHDPAAAAAEHRALVATVHLGARIALLCGRAHALEPAEAAPDAAALGMLGLEPVALADIAQVVLEPIQALTGAMLGA